MRVIFQDVSEMARYLKNSKNNKKTPFKVNIDGVERFTLSGNSDQAIAAVARQMGAKVESVSIQELLSAD